MSDSLARLSSGKVLHQVPSRRMINIYRKRGKRLKGQAHRIDDKICKKICSKEILVRWWRHDSLFGHFGRARNLERDEWVIDASNGTYGTVLLNTGAHLMEYNGSADVYHEIMKKVLELSIQLSKHGIKVVFRTTAPGHSDCMAFESPSAEEPPIPKDYIWNLIPNLNNIVWQVLGNRASIQISDIEHLTRLRPDCHLNDGDCLHILEALYKTWISLFLQILGQ